MNFSDLYGYIVFKSFEDLVDWLASCVPYTLLTIFILNCLFNIFSALIDLGGK